MLLVRHSRSLDVWSLGKDSEAKDAVEHRRSGDSLPVSTKPRLELTLKQSDDSTRGHHISSATISQCGQWVSCITGGAHFPVAHVYHLTVTVDRDGDRSVKASRVSLRFDEEACDALSAAKALRVSEWSGRQRPRILSQRGVFLGGGEGGQEGAAGGKKKKAKKGGKGSDKDAPSSSACRLALALPNGALAVLALHAPTQKKKGGKTGSSHATLDTVISVPVPSAAGGRSDLPDKAPVADISSSRDGRWVAVASANGTVEVFDTQGAEGKGQHHMSTPRMQAPITALGLRAGGEGSGGGGGENGELVVAMADNQVLFFDLAAKGLSEWSRSHPHLPAHFTRLPVPVDRVAFDPAHPSTVLLGSLDYLCHVDLKVRYVLRRCVLGCYGVSLFCCFLWNGCLSTTLVRLHLMCEHVCA